MPDWYIDKLLMHDSLSSRFPGYEMEMQTVVLCSVFVPRLRAAHSGWTYAMNHSVVHILAIVNFGVCLLYKSQCYSMKNNIFNEPLVNCSSMNIIN